MKEYRKGGHTKFAIEIHLWCTKYRKPILRGDIAVRYRAIARQECSELRVEVLSGVVAKDHVHMLVSMTLAVVNKTVFKRRNKCRNLEKCLYFRACQ